MSAMRKMGVYLGLLEDADGDYADSRTPTTSPHVAPSQRSDQSLPARWPTSRASPPGRRDAQAAADLDRGADVADHARCTPHLQRGPRHR
jgi:hypothetical protein